MPTSPTPKLIVELFYDVISPYCWISFETLVRYNRKFPQMELKLKPALLGSIMKELKHNPPPSAKSSYTKSDLVDLSNYFEIPFVRPTDTRKVMFEQGSLKAQRLLTVVANDYPLKLEKISQILFLRVWYQHRNISTMKGLRESCIDSGFSDVDADKLLQQITNSNIKKSLKNTTQDALNYGVFGLPSFIAHFPTGPKLFFGSDRLFLFTYLMNVLYPGPLHKYKSKFDISC